MSSSALTRDSADGAFQLVEVDASFSVNLRAARKPAGVGVALSGRGKGAIVDIDSSNKLSPLLAVM